MDSTSYEVENQLESSHWWFVGRRRLFRSLISGLQLRSDARILDVGTSTGTNLRLLKEMAFTNVSGLDLNKDAALFCHSKGLGPVNLGDITKLPLASNSFDLVLATDVVEHVDDDSAAMQELHRVLKPGGRVLLTVPAFQSLWGSQDEIAHHKRRYLLNSFRSLVENAGLIVEKAAYFNFLLFLPIWFARTLIRFLRLGVKNENELNSPLINWVLLFIFSIDLQLAPRLRPPFGVSILILASK